jgi:hypothetical protein
VLAGIDAASARQALERARELNPRGEEIAKLREQLDNAAGR